MLTAAHIGSILLPPPRVPTECITPARPMHCSAALPHRDAAYRCGKSDKKGAPILELLAGKFAIDLIGNLTSYQVCLLVCFFSPGFDSSPWSSFGVSVESPIASVHICTGTINCPQRKGSPGYWACGTSTSERDRSVIMCILHTFKRPCECVCVWLCKHYRSSSIFIELPYLHGFEFVAIFLIELRRG